MSYFPVRQLTGTPYVDAILITAGTGSIAPVPGGYQYVVFNSNGDFYAKVNAAAEVPTVQTFNGTASELNPSVWDAAGGTAGGTVFGPITSIGLIASYNTIITLAFY